MHIGNVACPVLDDFAAADLLVFGPVQREAAVVVLVAHFPTQQCAALAARVVRERGCAQRVPLNDAFSGDAGRGRVERHSDFRVISEKTHEADGLTDVLPDAVDDGLEQSLQGSLGVASEFGIDPIMAWAWAVAYKSARCHAPESLRNLIFVHPAT